MLFIPDKISEHNYRAVGSTEPERSARQEANCLRNKCQQAIHSCGIQNESVEYINWSRDVEESSSYISALQYVKNLYEVNDQFRIEIQESTKLALLSMKRGRERNVAESSKNSAIDLEEGVKYLLRELAFFSVVGDIYESCEKFVLVYHRRWSVLEKYFDGRYDNVPRPCLGFYVLE